MSSYQSGMDSVRNLTGSPIAGLDPHELLDTRWARQSVFLGRAASPLVVLSGVNNKLFGGLTLTCL